MTLVGAVPGIAALAGQGADHRRPGRQVQLGEFLADPPADLACLGERQPLARVPAKRDPVTTALVTRPEGAKVTITRARPAGSPSLRHPEAEPAAPVSAAAAALLLNGAVAPLLAGFSSFFVWLEAALGIGLLPAELFFDVTAFEPVVGPPAGSCLAALADALAAAALTRGRAT